MKSKAILSAIIVALSLSSVFAQLTLDCSSYNFSTCSSLNSCQGMSPTQCLIDKGIVNDPPCTKVSSPYVVNDCIAPIKKIISRPMRMTHMKNFILPLAHANAPADCKTDSDGDGIPDACLEESHECYHPFCPDRYCDEVGFLAEMGATMIFEAFSVGYNHHEVRANGTYMQTACQMVTDINAAYDYAGKPRPVIQATMLPTITQSLDNWPIKIPACVWEAFGYTNYDPDATFTWRDIVKDNQSGNNPATVDISKEMAQMWMFYEAMMYINAGFTSLHMGMIGGNNGFAENDNLGDPLDQFPATAKVFEMIRCYAQSVGSFVLINGERFPENTQLFHGNVSERKMLFDFDAAPMRPREMDDPINYCCEAMIDPNCVGACPSKHCKVNDGGNGMLPDFNPNADPCADEQYMAYMDTCIVNLWRHLEGGISPYGCEYDVIPFTVGFDFACSIVDANATEGQWIEGFDHGTYNWSDTYWFHNQISPECAAYFLEKTICSLKEVTKGYGTVKVSGLFIEKSDCNGVTPWSHRISQDPIMKSALQNTWLVDNVLEMEESNDCCGDEFISLECGGEIIRKEEEVFRKSDRCYFFSVQGPDCTSSYSWHVKRLSDGYWFPITYGNHLKIDNPIPGDYQITLRQDNYTLPNWGVKEIKVTRTLEGECCNRIPAFIGRTIDPQNEIFTLENPDRLRPEVHISPNPFNQNLTLNFELFEKDMLNIDIVDKLGRQVRRVSENNTFNKGAHQLFLNVAELNNDLYFLRLSAAKTGMQTFKIIKQNSNQMAD